MDFLCVCTHSQARHIGGMDGKCKAKGCDCEQYKRYDPMEKDDIYDVNTARDYGVYDAGIIRKYMGLSQLAKKLVSETNQAITNAEQKDDVDWNSVTEFFNDISDPFTPITVTITSEGLDTQLIVEVPDNIKRRILDNLPFYQARLEKKSD